MRYSVEDSIIIEQKGTDVDFRASLILFLPSGQVYPQTTVRDGWPSDIK